jgi:phosphoglycerate-specific signal transduction histidine kinase
MNGPQDPTDRIDRRLRQAAREGRGGPPLYGPALRARTLAAAERSARHRASRNAALLAAAVGVVVAGQTVLTGWALARILAAWGWAADAATLGWVVVFSAAAAAGMAAVVAMTDPAGEGWNGRFVRREARHG